MTKPKHTHPLGVLQQIAQALKDYWYLLVILLTARLGHLGFTISLILLILVFCGWPILRWATLTYQITPTAIIIHSGILVRHHEHIPYSRIQTVQRKQWFYLRPFQLEELLIETASHEDHAPEARLAAVPTTTAHLIARYRQTKPTTTTGSAAVIPDQTTVATDTVQAYYRINPQDLVKFGLTSMILVPFLLVLLGLYNKLQKSMTTALVTDATHLARVLLVGAIVALIVIAWLGAFIWTLQRYYHFELTRQADQLETARGFFQRNTVSAPLNRIQAVRFKQNLLRQWLHLQTVQVLIASKAAGDEDDNDLVIMPVIQANQAMATLHPFITWLPTTLPSLTALTVPCRRYQIRNALLIVAIPLGLLSYWLPTWAWISLPILLLAALQGYFSATNTAGGIITSNLLAVQTGHWWTRDRYFIPVTKIQSLHLRQSIWMKHTHLAHLTINVRHGNHNQEIQLRYLKLSAAKHLYAWYLQSTLQRPDNPRH